MRFGYGTNGFWDHRLNDALAIIADLGYEGVGLTLDHPHLDPFGLDVKARTAAIGRRLESLGLSVVVETGARYLLDPRRKHEPTLVSDTDRDVRVDLLKRAVRIADAWGARAVSFWSGILPPGADPDRGWERLVAGVEKVLVVAEELGVDCAFEPEPGMFVERLDDVLELRRRLGDPERLRVTLDVGHGVCNEPDGPEGAIARAGDLIANVQLDDMRPHVHEHLEFGEGEIDLPGVLGALDRAGYRGLASVELPRHGHAAPLVAERSKHALDAAWERAVRKDRV
ncbi:sugar phosphate isomerase/epimerase family protein [Nocardiopsis alba]|uniref:Xylose isomerase-like TIM barrel family protein n=1 Tax=Nocardiopsis alba (strain ATCC BAA-2165 / BE74) TaxID=1205910 RepID=J7LAG8_NOCAA|nr:sugar phosphate isomerase/epimerase family protein [Nocardiopsis alba]AFR09661.1 xylose isomerase-like TIM barrel family protein [Nocardiopsis alba ATCC BAA-2165]